MAPMFRATSSMADLQMPNRRPDTHRWLETLFRGWNDGKHRAVEVRLCGLQKWTVAFGVMHPENRIWTRKSTRTSWIPGG